MSKRSFDGRSLISLPLEGPNPQKVLRTFPGTPPGRWRGLPRRKESPLASLLREVPRLAAAEGVFLSVVSLALSFSCLTPSVALRAPAPSGRKPFGTGDRALGREPYSALKARRWPVAWRAGSRFCFVYALIFACGGFDPPCSRVPLAKQKAGPFRNGPAFVFGLL